jgi:hypothetical protein
MTEELIERLTAITKRQIQVLRARKEALPARAAGGPRPGLLYGFQLPGVEIIVSWALVAVHPDQQDLFLAVPADDNPQAGGDDVTVPASIGTGPLTLRCGYCTWILARHLQPDKLEGWIEEPQIREAREAIQAVASGRRRGGFEAGEMAATADYQDWMGLIAHAEHTLSEFLEQRYLDAERRAGSTD